jgi:hypothetical protein
MPRRGPGAHHPGLAGKLARGRLADLIDRDGAEFYDDRRRGYGAPRAHIARVLNAAAYVTMRDRAVAAGANVVAFGRSEPGGPMDEAMEDETVVSEQEFGFALGAGAEAAPPEARNGVIQFLVERHSELLAGLLDIKTEVFLR